MVSQNNLEPQASITRNLVEQFYQLVWLESNHLIRSFVRYRNESSSLGALKHLRSSSHSPLVSVIIPTTDADRGGRFRKLLGELSSQSLQDFELIVIKGDDRQGRAINTGADLSRGRYILTLDDDSSLPDPETFYKMVRAMETNPDIGMAGGNNTVPDWATPFVKQVMLQVPRRSWSPVMEITDSDLAEHPCLIIRRDLFIKVGGENELIPRGLDPYIRKQFRETGTRVVLLPGVIYHHLPPQTWKALLKQFYRNGYQAAYVNLHYPHWVIETPNHHGGFVDQVPLRKRLFRYAFRMLASIFSCQWIWFSCQMAYMIGFLFGLLEKRT